MHVGGKYEGLFKEGTKWNTGEMRLPVNKAAGQVQIDCRSTSLQDRYK